MRVWRVTLIALGLRGEYRGDARYFNPELLFAWRFESAFGCGCQQARLTYVSLATIADACIVLGVKQDTVLVTLNPAVVNIIWPYRGSYYIRSVSGVRFAGLF
jgi:hypothetical protein